MTKILLFIALPRALPSSRSDSGDVFVVLCVICLRVKVIIAMICRDLCDFLLTWNNDFAISIHFYVLSRLISFLFHFLRRHNFAGRKS